MWHCIKGLCTHKYGYIVHWMKTTIEVDDRLLIEAKKWAAEKRTTLRNLVERGLRDQPKPPWLLMAGTQRLLAVETFASLSALIWPLTSMIRFSNPSRLLILTMKSGKYDFSTNTVASSR